MFWQHWKLDFSPFDNVPDPRMYCDRNPSLEDAISEVLFAIDEGNDCLAVMVGDVGLGKTLALRVIMDELPPERYQIVSITNPDLTFNQLLREIVGQLKGQPVETRFKDTLQEEFNRLLFEAAGQGKRVVILVDEANVMNRASLQNLRLLTNMQDDDRNLVSIILAGQLELGTKLEAPGMSNLFQRIGVYSHIRGLETPEMVRDYVEFRMERAGAKEAVFTPGALQRVYHHSQGVPRLVNKLCKLALKAGETNGLQRIEAELVDKIAGMFDKDGQESSEAPVEAAAPGFDEQQPAAEPQAAQQEAIAEESAPVAGDAAPPEPEAAVGLPDRDKAWQGQREEAADEATTRAAGEPEPWQEAAAEAVTEQSAPVAADAAPPEPEPAAEALAAETPAAQDKPDFWQFVQAVANEAATQAAVARPATPAEPEPQAHESMVEAEEVASAAASEAAGPEQMDTVQTTGSPQADEAARLVTEKMPEPEVAGAPTEAQATGATAPSQPPRQAPAPGPQPRPGTRQAPRLRVVKPAREGSPDIGLTQEQVGQIVGGLPEHVIESIRSMDERQIVKLAGELAAKQMWQHEKAIRLSHGDPIDYWERSRTQIAALLRAINAGESASAAV